MKLKSNTQYASTEYHAESDDAAVKVFELLLADLADTALIAHETPLWDTLHISSERNQIEVGTIFHSTVESYTQWTAEVTTVREVEE